MSTSYPSIEFPDINTIPSDERDGYQYTAANGVTYEYDLAKETWIIRIDQYATESYVENAVSRRVSRYGDSMTGTITQKLDLSATSPTTGRFGFNLKDDGDGYRSFLDLNGDKAYIAFGKTGGQAYLYKGGKAVYRFYDDYTITYHPFRLDASITQAFLQTNSTNEHITWQVNKSPSKRTVQAGFDLTSSQYSVFAIRDRNGDERFSVTGVGRTKINSDSQYGFIVQRIGNPYGGTEDDSSADSRNIFSIDSKAMRLRANDPYDQCIRKGRIGEKGEIKEPNGNTKLYMMDADNLIATLGYVKDSKFHPGENLCADSEDDAEIGGLWKNGSSVFIRMG